MMGIARGAWLVGLAAVLVWSCSSDDSGSGGGGSGATAGTAGAAGTAGIGGTGGAGGTTPKGGSGGSTAGAAGNAAGAAGAAGTMGSSVKIRYLHHSTGGVVWDGGVEAWVTNYNTTNGTQYQISSGTFPDTGGGYPWANYPYDYWNLWINHQGSQGYMGEATLEMLTPEYDVIVFKHCFPVSGVGPDTGSPDVTSEAKTQENYKVQYAALKDKLHSFPTKRFIVWTGAALRQADTDADSAQRAKAFFDWVKGTWDEKGDNIFVWDFWQLETDGGLYLTEANATGDSHPNGTFAAKAAPLFGKRLVDVIEGRGDTGSLTGE